MVQYVQLGHGWHMFRNYINIALRNLAKYQIHSVINILGLSIGIAISILIMILVQDELSYDRYNKNWERIYRVNREASLKQNTFNGSLTPLALAGALNDIEGVQATTRLLRGSHKRVSYQENHYSADEFYYADNAFFDIFSIALTSGNRTNPLQEPYTLVITEETASKYFDQKDPVGEVLHLDNGWKFTITAVCDNVPDNSHFHFDFLASSNGIFSNLTQEAWLADMLATYILIEEDTEPDEIAAHFPQLVEDNILPDLEDFADNMAGFFSEEDYYRFYLQALKDIHFSTDLDGSFEAGTHKVYIYVFTFIALIILFIACVNFMNLATARSATRVKEIALRKVMGASRKQMIVQFLSESVFFSILSLFLSLVILEILLRPFNTYSGKNLDIFYLDSWYLLPSFILGALLIGIFAGSYPAFYLSSFKVMNIIRGRNFKGMKSTRLRGFLVLTQFSVSIILFISSMIMYQQVKFFKKTNLGFNKNNIVVVQRAYALMDRPEEFKEALLEYKGIKAASISMSLPGRISEHFPFQVDTLNKDKLFYLRPMAADYDFLKTMQMHLLEGDFYTRDDSSCYASLLINETAVQELGLEHPIGMSIMGLDMWGQEMAYTIKGVVKDYHYESLHQEIQPLAITLLPEKAHPQYLSVRIAGTDMDASIAHIENLWKEFVAEEPFDYYFLDSDLNKLYKEEETTASIFTIFSFLAIFIASLGLFGLASHTAEQRTREIGIRKAMGASIEKITIMLSARFTRWVLWSNLIAFPLAYAGMKIWLNRFAYHINIEAWLFFLAAILALAVALITVSFQAIRSAKESPINALQYE